MTRIPPLNTLVGEMPKAADSPSARPVPARPEAPLATTVSLGDTVKSSGTQAAPALESGLKSVQSQLAADAPSLTSAEIRRLLNGPGTLSKMQSLLQRDPALKQNIAAAGGEQLLKLIETASKRPLSKDEVKTLQRILIEQTHANIAYRGSSTGIDGNYGKLTHNALLSLLARSAQSDSPAKPSVASGAAASQAPKPVTPPVTPPAAPAAKPETPAAPVSDKPAEPEPTAPLEDTDNEPIKVPDLLNRLQQPNQSIETMAKLILQLPDTEREKLTTLATNTGDGNNLASLLAEAAVAPLTNTETKNLQALLVKAGEKLGYPGNPTGVDGNFGSRSQIALVRVVSKLLTGQTLVPTQPMPRYDRMLSDNLLDMTMAVGFDEGTYQYAGANTFEEKKVEAALAERGFVHDDAKAKELLKAAGKEVQAGGYTALYVKENVDTHDGKPVHAVVRLIESGDGTHGAASRQAAIEGMNQSDVFAYGGHGRYGNGPDFDRNFTVTVDWDGVANAPASGKVVYKDYEQLKELLGHSDAEAIKKLQSLEKAGKITIEAFNDGNIRMNEAPLHSAEFGSGLTHRALEQKPNSLAQEIKGDQYKLWLFEACRTRDFVAPIRHQSQSSPALNAQNLDLLTTEQVMYWENTGASMLALLDGVMAKDTAPALAERLRAVNPEQSKNGPTHSLHGFEDNPRK